MLSLNHLKFLDLRMKAKNTDLNTCCRQEPPNRFHSSSHIEIVKFWFPSHGCPSVVGSAKEHRRFSIYGKGDWMSFLSCAFCSCLTISNSPRGKENIPKDGEIINCTISVVKEWRRGEISNCPTLDLSQSHQHIH